MTISPHEQVALNAAQIWAHEVANNYQGNAKVFGADVMRVYLAALDAFAHCQRPSAQVDDVKKPLDGTHAY